MTGSPASGNGWRSRLAAAAEALTTPAMVTVAAVAVMHGTTQTMFRPLIAPYAASLGAGSFLAGAAVAVQALPGLVLAVPVGSAADRVGPGRILGAGGASIAAGGALIAAVDTLPTLYAGMLLTGLGTMCVALAAQGLATRSDPGASVDTRRVAMFGTFVLVGHLIGPVLGGVFSDLGGYRAAFLAVGLLGVAFVIVTIALQRRGRRRAAAEAQPAARGVTETETDEVRDEPPAGSRADTTPARGVDDREEERGAYRRARTLLGDGHVPATLLISGAGPLLLTLRTSFLPLYLDRLGWSASAIGLLLSATAGAAIVSRTAFPWVERTFAPRAVLRISIIGGALAISAAVATSGVLLIVVATAWSGVLLGTINPSSLTLLAQLVGPRQRQLALGMRITVNRVSQSAGPALFGALAAAGGGLRPAFFVITGIAAVAGGLLTRGLQRPGSG